MDIQKKTKKEYVDEIKALNLPVVIFGSGVVGEALFHCCTEAGISPACFCDNNINKTKQALCGIPVIFTPEIKKQYPDAVVVISAADIKDVLVQLDELGFPNRYPGSILLQNFDIYQYTYTSPAEFVDFAVGASMLCHDSFFQPDKVFLRSVDIVITERCSLRCRDCSNLMQYFKNPVDESVEDVIRSIDALVAYADEIHECRVIGGEPFMHPQCAEIVKRIIDEPKVKKIVIYTNGTITPKEEQLQLMHSDKVLVFITDYDLASAKREKLIDALKKNKIAFYVYPARWWTDCATIIKHNRSVVQQIELFKRCCAKNTITLSQGKLFRCPFSANAHRLQAIDDYTGDYVDIVDAFGGDADIVQMKEQVKKFLLEKTYLGACEFCNGRSFDDPEIKPAVQIPKPLDYTSFADGDL